MHRIQCYGKYVESGRSVVRGIWLLAAILSGLLLSASAPAVEVRVIDPMAPVYDAESALNASRVDELLLVAPRNASASAQVVVVGTGAGGLRAVMGDLSRGESVLPPDAVEIRYAWREEGYDPRLADREDGGTNELYGAQYLQAYYDRLLPEPRAGAELVPVWVTVHVPEDAGPGTYTGELVIGGEHSVTVRLMVSDWICPDPADFTSQVGVVPSHEVLAWHYGVDFWSEEHWRLIEQQMGFLGALGADDLWLHVNAKIGYEQGMALVHFTREGEEVVPDMAVARRYARLFSEHVGRPSNVIMNYWMRATERDGRPMSVFVDGRPEQAPRPEEPGGEEFWGSVMESVRELVVEFGWPEESILIGQPTDSLPLEETVRVFERIAPYASWLLWTHGRGHTPLQSFDAGEPIVQGPGMRIGYYAHPYPPRYRVTPYFAGGWTLNHPVYSSARNYLVKYAAPSQWRNFPNGQLIGHPEHGIGASAGFSFVFMDFWDLEHDEERYVHVSRNNFRHSSQPFLRVGTTNMTRRSNPSIVEPGPDGPVGTVRFEMLREGLQETEARVAVERALAQGALDEETASEARTLLAKLFDIRYKQGAFRASNTRTDLRSRTDILWGRAEYPQWMELTMQLYDMASRVNE